MYIMLFLILVSLLIATGFLFAYLWAINNGQYDDNYTPSVRMLFDDTNVEPLPKHQENKPDTNIEKSPTL